MHDKVIKYIERQIELVEKEYQSGRDSHTETKGISTLDEALSKTSSNMVGESIAVAIGAAILFGIISGGSFGLEWLIPIAFVFFFSLIISSKRTKRWLSGLSERKAALEDEKQSIEFYLRAKKALDKTGDLSNSAIRRYASSLGLNPRPSAQSAFHEGEKAYAKYLKMVDTERKKQAVKEQSEKDQATDSAYQKQLNVANLTGRSHYEAIINRRISDLRTQIAEEEKEIRGLEAVCSAFDPDLTRRDVRKEAIRGRIIGGPSYGTARAIEAAEHNRRVDEQLKDGRPAGVRSYMYKLTDDPRFLKRKGHVLHLEEVVHDMQTLKEKMKGWVIGEPAHFPLDIKAEKICSRYISPSFIEASASLIISCPEKPTLFGEKAEIDGTLTVVARQNGVDVGAGYFVTDVTHRNVRVAPLPHFADSYATECEWDSIYIKAFPGKEFDAFAKTKFKIVPMKVWALRPE